VRQFRGFDRARIAGEFAVPDHWQVTSMSAVGRLPAGAEPPGPVPLERSRRPLAEITWPAAGRG
jgi:hypothetical protein